MARYAFQARDGRGELLTGTLAAASIEEASAQLRGEGKFIVRLKPVTERDERKPLPPTGRVKRNDVIVFAHQLAVMVDTGVPISEALDSVTEQVAQPAFKAVLEEVCSHVQGGSELSAALARHPKVFPSIMVSLIKAAEVSGQLAEMLDRIATYMTKEAETRRKVRGALMYPMVMFTLAVGVTVFLLTFVLPRFSAIYASRGAALPVPTQVLITVSDALTGYWYAWVGGIAAVVVASAWFVRTPRGRRLFDRFKLRAPVLGHLFTQLYLCRSARTLGTMLNSGVAMLDAIAITRETTVNVHYAELWDHVDEKLRQGCELSEPLFHSDLIPRSVAQMIRSGERSGRLGLVMHKVANFSESEFDSSVKSATEMIEPAIIGVMGGMIGFVAISLLLPIFAVGRVVSS